jgi:putative ABC transport system substrate-binding protein
MDRRTFLGASAGSFAAVLRAAAEPTGKIWHIGYLSPAAAYNPIDAAFDRGMKDFGYVEGQNLRLERRYTAGRLDRLPAAAADFVRLNVDVIVAWTQPAAVAVKNATGNIPTVFLGGGDPERSGLAASVRRPGGNITGISFQLQRTALQPKLLQLVKELLPMAVRVVVLRFPAEEVEPLAAPMDAAAKALGLRLQMVAVQSPDDLKQAFTAIEQERPQALVGVGSGLLYLLRREIVDFVATRRLPAVFGLREVAEEGGLLSFSPSLSDIAVRAAYYVHKLLTGSKASDLPIEQSTKFELVINLKTAKALGLTIPPSLLQRADQVIE